MQPQCGHGVFLGVMLELRRQPVDYIIQMTRQLVLQLEQISEPEERVRLVKMFVRRLLDDNPDMSQNMQLRLKQLLFDETLERQLRSTRPLVEWLVKSARQRDDEKAFRTKLPMRTIEHIYRRRSKKNQYTALRRDLRAGYTKQDWLNDDFLFFAEERNRKYHQIFDTNRHCITQACLAIKNKIALLRSGLQQYAELFSMQRSRLQTLRAKCTNCTHLEERYIEIYTAYYKYTTSDLASSQLASMNRRIKCLTAGKVRDKMAQADKRMEFIRERLKQLGRLHYLKQSFQSKVQVFYEYLKQIRIMYSTLELYRQKSARALIFT